MLVLAKPDTEITSGNLIWELLPQQHNAACAPSLPAQVDWAEFTFSKLGTAIKHHFVKHHDLLQTL